MAIKVDREERPDVDAVYMTATQAMTGQGGWPMTVFATPDGEPFFCGTYYPRATFRRLVARGRRRRGGTSATRWLRAGRRPWSRRSPSRRAGGWSAVAARSPPSCSTRPRRELRRGVRPDARRVRRRAEVPAAHGAAVPAAPPPAHRRRARAGDRAAHRRGDGPGRHLRPARRRVRPVLGGRALDGAALREDAVRQRSAAAGLHPAVAADRRRAGAAGGRPRRPSSCSRDLRTAEGGFASSLDADTDGVEGATYVWTPAQLGEVLGRGRRRLGGRPVRRHRRPARSSTARSVLRLARDIDDADEPVTAAVGRRAASGCSQARAAGRSRPATTRWSRPGTGWRSPRWPSSPAVLGTGAERPRPTCPPMAAAAAALAAGDLHAASTAGCAGCPATAWSASRPGCWTTTAAWPRRSARCTSSPARGGGSTSPAACSTRRVAHFADGGGGFFDTADDAERLVARPADPTDNATPSGLSALAAALVSYIGADRRDRTTGRRRAGAGDGDRRSMARHPRFAGYAGAGGRGAALRPVRDRDRRARMATQLVAGARRHAPPGAVVVVGRPDQPGVAAAGRAAGDRRAAHGVRVPWFRL